MECRMNEYHLIVATIADERPAYPGEDDPIEDDRYYIEKLVIEGSFVWGRKKGNTTETISIDLQMWHNSDDETFAAGVMHVNVYSGTADNQTSNGLKAVWFKRDMELEEKTGRNENNIADRDEIYKILFNAGVDIDERFLLPIMKAPHPLYSFRQSFDEVVRWISE